MTSPTSTFLPGLEASPSLPKPKASARSDSARSTRTPVRFSLSGGPASPTSATFEELSLLFDQLSSPLDSLASRGVSPGSAEARQMTVTSGRQLAGFSKHTGPLGSLVKMCLESSAWGSDLCVPIWKASVTPSNRLLFRLALWEPGTAASESGLLPTLTVTGNSNATGAGPKSADGLSTAIKAFLPTLTATDAEQAKFHKRGNPMLGMAVRSLMPTLVASDAKGGDFKKPQGGPSLRSVTSELGTGPLNPRWCEWFMGYPVGHTELKPSATPSSRRSSGPSSASSRKSKGQK